MSDCRHVEHRYDRATDRRIGLDARLNEWQPCPECGKSPQEFLVTAHPCEVDPASCRGESERGVRG